MDENSTGNIDEDENCKDIKHSIHKPVSCVDETKKESDLNNEQSDIINIDSSNSRQNDVVDDNSSILDKKMLVCPDNKVDQHYELSSNIFENDTGNKEWNVDILKESSTIDSQSMQIDMFESFSDEEKDVSKPGDIQEVTAEVNNDSLTFVNVSTPTDDFMTLKSVSDESSNKSSNSGSPIPVNDESANKIQSLSLACEAKKRKSEEEESDSNDDEYMDAQGDAGKTRPKASKKLRRFLWGSHSSSDSGTLSSSTDSSRSKYPEKKHEEKLDEENWLKKDIKSLPDPVWRATCALKARETLQSSLAWPMKVCGSYAMVNRFQLHSELDKHLGCVNALHFNQTGNLIASGSDDLKIMLWDWINSRNEPVVKYESGHKSNVFQAKFLPNSHDATVVSSARDGQVRVADISSTGTCRNTKKVAQHRGSAHKLALNADSKSTFLSCGEDGVVFGFDLRCDKPAEKLVTVRANNRKISLYSIHSHPLRPYEFAVSGRDENARIFDRRMLTGDESTDPVKLYCPHHLQSVQNAKANITCLVYNWDGSELLCSYNDEDIYLFDTSHSTGADYIKRYKGHRNNATVKGVNFYGPNSEFIVSGSDCANIFFWEKQSSRVVALLEGDRGGVVNVLEPHPNLPVIATSGLDHQVKIWTPHGEPNDEEKLSQLNSLMLSNLREREEDRRSMPEMIDGHMLWFLMRSLRSRHRGRDNDSSSDDELDSSDDSSASSDASDRMRQCVQS